MKNNKKDKVDDLHERAMEYSDSAFLVQKSGNKSEAIVLFKKALVLEKEAALILEKENVEPLRSVLFRSAAWLAVHAELPDEAVRMAAFGLAINGGTSPIEKELHEVMAKALSMLDTAIAA